MEKLEINFRIAKRLWKFISRGKGINPSLDGSPVTYENAPLAYRAFCRTLAWEAMEELGIIEPLERPYNNGMHRTEKAVSKNGDG